MGIIVLLLAVLSAAFFLFMSRSALTGRGVTSLLVISGLFLSLMLLVIAFFVLLYSGLIFRFIGE